MAKLSKIANNERKKEVVARYKEKRLALRAAAKNSNLTEEERTDARRKLEALPRNSCENRIRNRCKVTGRPRGVYRKFEVSRLTFRQMAHKGLLPGITKASW
ncbi:MAG: 30S ribosomal protein S14 [Oligoflexia bacterium]|nr:30S ribosomal protein S14 [Oligoflexia bacterium]